MTTAEGGEESFGVAVVGFAEKFVDLHEVGAFGFPCWFVVGGFVVVVVGFVVVGFVVVPPPPLPTEVVSEPLSI